MEDMTTLLSSQDKLLDVVARLTPGWLAGFFDGEGSVSTKLEHGGTVRTLRVCLYQKDPTVLCLVSLKFPGANFGSQTRVIQSGKATTKGHSLEWVGNKAQPFLEYIKDHSIVKKELIALGLEMLKHTTYVGGKLNDQERASRMQVAEKILQINRKSRETTPIEGEQL
jgi:hypothetical protein